MNEKCWHTSSEKLLPRLKEKWILFDTSAIAQLIEHDAHDLWQVLEQHDITPCSLDLITLELLAHLDVTERARRLEAIGKMPSLALSPQDSKVARKLQNELHAVTSKGCKPSPTDLYIGAVAARFPTGKLLIATENIKDFPKPYFERLGYILFESKMQTKTVCIMRLSEQTRSRIIN